MLQTKQLLLAIDFHITFLAYYGSQWLPSSVSEERNSYRFQTTLRWINDVNILSFGLTDL